MKSLAGLVIVVVVGLLVFGLIANIVLGVGVWGPTRIQEVTVTSSHVDIEKSSDSAKSHYMVTTDKGVFEVDNSLLLNIWNADELYGKLQNGKQYTITTKGNRVVGMLFQEYPYVTAVEPLLAGYATNAEYSYSLYSLYPTTNSVFLGKEREKPSEFVYDVRSNDVPLVVILKDGTKVRYDK